MYPTRLRYTLRGSWHFNKQINTAVIDFIIMLLILLLCFFLHYMFSDINLKLCQCSRMGKRRYTISYTYTPDLCGTFCNM